MEKKGIINISTMKNFGDALRVATESNKKFTTDEMVDAIYTISGKIPQREEIWTFDFSDEEEVEKYDIYGRYTLLKDAYITVMWGDGNLSTFKAEKDCLAEFKHHYETAGVYNATVVLNGDCRIETKFTKTVAYYIVKFWSIQPQGNVLYDTKYVAPHGIVFPPAITPTRKADNRHYYHFNGWDSDLVTRKGAFVDITEDRNYYTNWRLTDRYYDVHFYNGDTLVRTNKFKYGEFAVHGNVGSLKDPVTGRTGFVFSHWDNGDKAVWQDDMIMNAVWVQNEWTNKEITDSWDEIYDHILKEDYGKYYRIGMWKNFSPDGNNYKARIAAMNLDTASDKVYIAPFSFILDQVPNATVPISGGRYSQSNLYSTISEWYNSYDNTLKKVIIKVTKDDYVNSSGGTPTVITGNKYTTDVYTWAPGLSEFSFTNSPIYYKDYVKNFKLKKVKVNTTTASAYWLRDRVSSSSGYIVNTSGNVGTTGSSNYTAGGFCVGAGTSDRPYLKGTPQSILNSIDIPVTDLPGDKYTEDGYVDGSN